MLQKLERQLSLAEVLRAAQAEQMIQLLLDAFCSSHLCLPTNMMQPISHPTASQSNRPNGYTLGIYTWLP